MGGNRRICRLVSVVAVLVVFVAPYLCGAGPNAFGAETNSTSADKGQPSESDTAWGQHVVQSYQQLQDQQQSMLREIEQTRQDAAANARAVEQARQDAESAAKHYNDEMEARLNRIEQSVTVQREREIETMQSSHRFTFVMVGLFAVVGFFGMLFFAVFLMRVMNRRTETMIAHFTGQALGPGFMSVALGAGETQVVSVNRMEQSTARFLNTIDRLEKRINDLEGTGEPATNMEESIPKKPVTPMTETAEASTEAPEPKAMAEMEASMTRVKSEQAEREARLALLLGKGQALLNLHQADTALACFDEVIAIDSTNPEAFVKKGMALERLGKLDEAIDCYDRAIALDDSMTMAYLSKGGVFNRLERYGEALQCYEQALRAQQKPSIA
jgi:tetratricopeptide (TPR) repeat protein